MRRASIDTSLDPTYGLVRASQAGEIARGRASCSSLTCHFLSSVVCCALVCSLGTVGCWEGRQGGCGLELCMRRLRVCGSQLAVCLVSLFVSVCRSCVSSSTLGSPPLLANPLNSSRVLCASKYSSAETADQLLPPYGACAAQRGRGIRDGCGPLSRGIAGRRSAPHAPPSCNGATATAAPPRLPPRGCRNRCPEPPFATSARNGGAADALPTGKHHWKGGGERKRRKMSSSSRSSLK